MKKFLQKRKRKGFTLVELLIVIIIIGILAGSMLLVMGAGRDKAEATKIVSNLRNLKAAALMYYADNNKWWGTDATANDTLGNYMDGTVDGNYILYASSKDITDTSFDHWVGYAIDSADKGQGVKDKLELMNKDVSIYAGGDSAPTKDKYDGDSGVVWMPID